MQSPPADNPSGDRPGQTRLDRELDEILAKNENIRLLPPPPEATSRPPTRIKPKSGLARPPMESSMIPPKARELMASPVILAVGLAIVALLVSGLSPLLANLLCLAAVVCVLAPMVQRFRGRPTAPPEIRMWRGQVMDAPPPRQPSPIDAARDWWKSRQR